jgi:hypothetical protein
MMRVLMLDFDGVLHPAQGCEVEDFAYAPLLAEALEGLRCRIVISSTWRDSFTLEQLRRLLPAELAVRVVDALGPDAWGRHVRYRNILRWLESQKAAIDWRALDDTVSEFPPGCPQLVLCDGRIGFSKVEAGILRSWLLEPRSKASG